MPESFAESALRHYADADHLADRGRLDGAGYLIGYAVECAIKATIEATRPTESAPHKHLPELVERAKKTLQGQQRRAIFSIIEQDGFMAGWSVDARYEANGHVDASKYAEWRKHASRTLGAANLRRKTQ